MIKQLFIDIETSPNIVYSWRNGDKIFIDHNSIIEERKIICICYKWEHEKTVKSVEWNNGDDTDMIRFIHEVICLLLSLSLVGKGDPLLYCISSL